PAQSASRQLPLTKLAKGTRARILSLRELDSFGINDESVSQRLKELGFLPGATLTVIGFGLFGSSPIAVQINGTKFALRTAEASKIIVEPLQS
ncbi:MAG TPA: FeoA family protein, partial [Pseudomonadales bacterium]|nr:FeoA family protein [Pseudomonadales bacterium]